LAKEQQNRIKEFKKLHTPKMCLKIKLNEPKMQNIPIKADDAVDNFLQEKTIIKVLKFDMN